MLFYKIEAEITNISKKKLAEMLHLAAKFSLKRKEGRGVIPKLDFHKIVNIWLGRHQVNRK